MSVLSGETIRQLSERPQRPLITPFATTHCQGSSYDLTMGGQYYVHRRGWDQAVCRPLHNGECLAIPPGELAFLITEETLWMPACLSARASLALSLTRQGLLLGAQPPIDPGYQGKLICLLHNLSQKEVVLGRGQHVLSLEFLPLDCPTGITFSREGHVQGLHELKEVLRGPCTAANVDLRGQIESVRRELLTYASILVALAAIVFALLKK